MCGILYGIGVGPGDPELMTLKAVRLIREADVIVVPAETAEAPAAYRIARAAVPEMARKEVLPLSMPMTRDRETLEKAWCEAAEKLKHCLDQGKNAAFLTLGDPSLYSTFGYLRRLLQKDGCTVLTAAGVPSFCAVAACLDLSLAEGDEALHIVTSVEEAGHVMDLPGTVVLMKPSDGMGRFRDLATGCGKEASGAEDCGRETEKVWRSAREIPDRAGYFSLVIASDARA